MSLQDIVSAFKKLDPKTQQQIIQRLGGAENIKKLISQFKKNGGFNFNVNGGSKGVNLQGSRIRSSGQFDDN